MTEPVISVIVPVYKTEKYLDKCVQSIVDQTYTKLEIILVNDGSPDHCPEMCDRWVGKDSRIKVIHKKNGGVASARNAGLEQASGEYIAFVDSDDYLEPDIYERLLLAMVENGADISVCGYQVNDENRGSDEVSTIATEDALKRIAQGDYKFGLLGNKLYKKSVIADTQVPPLVCCEDLVFNYFVFKKASVITMLSLNLYHYYQNMDSATNSPFNPGAFDALKSKEIILKDCNENILESAVYGYICSSYVLLNAVSVNKEYIDRFSELRKGILKYKKLILFTKKYSIKDKIKTSILWLAPKIYTIIFSKRK